MKNSIKLRTLLTLLLLSGLFFSIKTLQVGIPQAQAQSSNVYDLAVSPQVVYWHVRPGEMITHTINIKNQGVNTIEVYPEMVDFMSNGLDGIPVLQNNHSFPYTSIINPDVFWKKPFLLRPGQEKNIKLRIEPPIDVDEKEHHITVLFRGKQAVFEEIGNDAIYNTVEDSNSIVSGTVGSNMVVLVADSDQNNGKLSIKDLKIPRVVDSFKPIIVSILAENEGLNATPIQGKASFISLSKKRVIEYTFYPDMILANSTRKVRGIDSSVIDEIKETGLEQKELEQLTTELSYKRPFLFGIYTIEVILGEETQTTNVIAFPISPLVFISVVAIILVGSKTIKKKMGLT